MSIARFCKASFLVAATWIVLTMPAMSQSLAIDGPVLVRNGVFTPAESTKLDPTPSQTPTELRSETTPIVRGTRSSEGDWGVLESFPVYLEAPEFLIEKFPIPSSQTRWVIPESAVAELESLLTTTGSREEVTREFFAQTRKVTQNGKVYFFPPSSALQSLSANTRDKTYAFLGKFPENEYHGDPVLILNDNPEDWFLGSGLRPELVDAIKSLTYQRGGTLAFSDISVLIKLSMGEAESRKIIKALTRTRSYVMKIVVSKETNLNALLEYWTTGMNTRRKDIEPFLHSVSLTPGGEKVDVLHLLPPLPRKLLMTYPDLSHGLDGQFPDCHWTTLNFFNYREQAYLLDSRLAGTAVQERFAATDRPFKFGDIIMCMDRQTNAALHSCVYVADDFVFTKNGRNVLCPWILMKLSDIEKIYANDESKKLQGYRVKGSAN